MIDSKISLLIVDDDANTRKTFGDILKLRGYDVEGAGTGAEAIACVQKKFFNIAVIDMKLPDISGFDVLEKIMKIHEDMVPIVITAYASMDSAIEAMNRGAYSYVTKPVNMDEVFSVLNRALEKQRLSIENKRLRERFSMAADAAGIGVWEYDVAQDVLIWDDWMWRLYGQKPEAFASASEAWAKGVHPDDQGRIKQEIQMALRDGNVFYSEFRVVWPDGGVRYLMASARVVRDKADKSIRMVGINYDVTERKKVLEKLTELSEMKSVFVSMLSHEFNYPLTIIGGGLDLVLDGLAGSLSENQRHFLSSAKDNAERLGRLVRDVLDFEKLELGKMQIDIQKNDLNEAVMEACEGGRFLSKGKKLSFSLNLDKDLPKILFDRDKILGVLTNLIGNAVIYTKKGGITVTTQRESNVAHVVVQDTGPGIKREDLGKLFQPFMQFHELKGRKKGGTGLGLAISKEIILAHHGKIWAESEVDKGTAMHFNIPIQESDGVRDS
ncbi:MAG: ATP-binding protein [Candidatus Omnitrophota bacterium]